MDPENIDVFVFGNGVSSIWLDFADFRTCFCFVFPGFCLSVKKKNERAIGSGRLARVAVTECGARALQDVPRLARAHPSEEK